RSERTADIFPDAVEKSDAPRDVAPSDSGLPDGERPDDVVGNRDREDEDDKGHGRRPASDYRGADRVCVEHDSLKPGEACPACRRGKVYPYRPRIVVRVRGGAPLTATRYEMQRLRCNLCGEIYTARPPPQAAGPKYDETAAAII